MFLRLTISIFILQSIGADVFASLTVSSITEKKDLSLQKMMSPEILAKFADFLESTGGDNSLIERYEWFAKNSENGTDCRYARMAKDLFIAEHADKTAEAIKWLYENWAKHV